MDMWPMVILTVYLSCLVFITLYCLLQFHLLIHYTTFKRKEKKKDQLSPVLNGNLPFVTIQLPVFNEFFVINRLVDNIMKLDYPKDKFEVHILDDSTDETLSLSGLKVKEYKDKGFNIELIQRDKRVGYKAGALKDAMLKARGEFIAIFDADFLPDPTFLRATLPFFENKSIGLVQTRWGHLNQDYSFLTQLQAFQLNVHFTVEQLGRQSANYLLQFNGTAGIWRRETIEDAGGWEADTLTEDLDLSYRAQLKGWEIMYLESIMSPAELPAEMNGLKSQQYRWMKGGAETARKLLPQVWASNLNAFQKLHATSHLLSSSIFLFIFFLGVFSVPMLFLINHFVFDKNIMSVFLVSLIAIIAVYYVANVETAWKGQNKLKSVFTFIVLFPLFLSLSMGLSFHNSLAVIQGFLGKKSAFIRTPKFNIMDIGGSIRQTKYLQFRLPGITIFEGILALYFLLAILGGIYLRDGSMMILHLLLFLGYSIIFVYSIKHLQYR